MKIITFPHQEIPGKLLKGWLFTLNLFFIIYSVVMLGKFLLGPQSGRISTLVCKPDQWGKNVCTVKIYGVHKLFRLDFYADDYMGTELSTNFRLGEYARPYLNDLSLPWDNSMAASSSGDYACALSIRIQSQLVDFVPPYQTGSACTKAEALVKAAFHGDRSAINLRFNGTNPQVYWRSAVLVIACLLFLVQCALRLSKRKHEKNAAILTGQPKDNAQSGANLIHSSPDLQSAEKVTHPVQLGRKRFVLFWWMASVLVIVFLVITSLLNSLVRRGFELEDCFLSIHDYQKLYMIHPITDLIAILPFVIIVTLGMALQWQVLRTQLPVSGWWIAAPVIAGIPLLVGLPPAQSCTDFSDITLPFSLFTSSPPAAVGWSWVIYFLTFGLIQWLVLRKYMKYSLGWIVIPFLSVFGGAFLLFDLFVFGVAYSPIVLPDALILPGIILWALIVLLLATIFNLVTGFYAHWAIHKKQASQVKHVPDRARDGV